MLHVWNMKPKICPNNHPNVGKYTIQGAYGSYIYLYIFQRLDAIQLPFKNALMIFPQLPWKMRNCIDVLWCVYQLKPPFIVGFPIFFQHFSWIPSSQERRACGLPDQGGLAVGAERAGPGGHWECGGGGCGHWIVVSFCCGISQLIGGLEHFSPTIVQLLSGWWFGTWLLFSPIVGMMIQSDFHSIFQRGRAKKHQPVKSCVMCPRCSVYQIGIIQDDEIWLISWFYRYMLSDYTR